MDSATKYDYKWKVEDRTKFEKLIISYVGHFSSVDTLITAVPVGDANAWARVSTLESESIYVWTTQVTPHQWIRESSTAQNQEHVQQLQLGISEYATQDMQGNESVHGVYKQMLLDTDGALIVWPQAF